MRARTWVWLIAAGLVALLFLGVAERAAYSGKVMPGVRVDGVSIAGKSELSAYHDLVTLGDRLDGTPIRVKIDGQHMAIDPKLIGFRLDPAASVRAARMAGRSRNPIEQVAGTVLRRFRADDVPLVVGYDGTRLAGVLDSWTGASTTGLVEGGLQFNGGTVTEVLPRAGHGLLRGRAEAQLRATLASADRAEITLPTGTVRARVDRAAVDRAAVEARKVLTGGYMLMTAARAVVITPAQLSTAMGTTIVGDRVELRIDPDKLRTALGGAIAPLETPPVDASFTITPQNAVQVVPSQIGHAIDMSAVAAAILAGQRIINAPVHDRVPVHDTRWAAALDITGQVSTFTTHHPAGQPRVHNIHLAADVINNTIVEPGQVFSLNDKLGPRTRAKGYVEAPVIGEGELATDVGGGISQLTTTLYNAVFWGGYQDVEHTPHSIYISRYPMGREATINYGVTDLKFRNDTPHGLLIRTSYSDTSITVSFYGNTDGRTVQEIDRKVLATEPITQQLIACPAPPTVDKNNVCATLPAGAQKSISSGETGLTVTFTQVIDQPGKPEFRKKFTWRYQMFQDKILVGAAAGVTTTTTPGSTVPGAPPTAAPTTPTTAPKPPTTPHT